MYNIHKTDYKLNTHALKSKYTAVFGLVLLEEGFFCRRTTNEKKLILCFH